MFFLTKLAIIPLGVAKEPKAENVYLTYIIFIFIYLNFVLQILKEQKAKKEKGSFFSFFSKPKEKEKSTASKIGGVYNLKVHNY